MSKAHDAALTRFLRALAEHEDAPGYGCPHGLRVSWRTLRYVAELAIGRRAQLATAFDRGLQAGIEAATSVPYGQTYRTPDNPYRQAADTSLESPKGPTP